jgi:drug/metabolite transporter (DMT)-like permease
MGALSHSAGEVCDWRYVAFARAFVAFLLTLGIARASGARLVFRGPGSLWVRSIAGSIGVVTSFYAVTHLPVSDAITLNTTSSIWVTILGWAVLGQPAGARTWTAVAAGFAGVALIEQPHFASGGLLASALGLASAVCAATAMLGLNRLRNVDPWAVVAHFSGVSSVVTLAVLLASDALPRWHEAAAPSTLGLLVGVGAAGVLGQFGMTLAFTHGNAARVSVVGLTQILFSLLFDVVVWRRDVNAISLAGMALVALPTAWLLLNRPEPVESSLDASAFDHSLHPV